MKLGRRGFFGLLAAAPVAASVKAAEAYQAVGHVNAQENMALSSRVARVTFDGEDQKLSSLVVADDVVGYVELYSHDRLGRLRVRDRKIVRERKHGEVRIYLS